jgi:hypothetical protein
MSRTAWIVVQVLAIAAGIWMGVAIFEAVTG